MFIEFQLENVSYSPFSIRFRAAWKAQGHSIEELPYQALGGVYGSWLGFILVCLVLIANFYVVRPPALFVVIFHALCH
jgi:amino acid permease